MSSAGAKYHAMAHTTAELVWLHHLLLDLGISCHLLMTLICDNKAALQIAANPTFHERTNTSILIFNLFKKNPSSTHHMLDMFLPSNNLPTCSLSLWVGSISENYWQVG